MIKTCSPFSIHENRTFIVNNIAIRYGMIALLIVCLRILPLWGGSRCFGCLLLIMFIRRWCRLGMCHCAAPQLFVIGAFRSSLRWFVIGGFRSPLFWLDAAPSAVFCGSDRLLCCLTLGIHASGIFTYSFSIYLSRFRACLCERTLSALGQGYIYWPRPTLVNP